MGKTSFLLLLFVTCLPGLTQRPAEQKRNKQIARSFFEEVLGQARLDRYAESHCEDFGPMLKITRLPWNRTSPRQWRSARLCRT